MNGIKPSVLLVREEDAQLTGSGCCGKLEGDNTRFGDQLVFAESRQIMEKCGTLADAIRQRFGDRVEVTLVDPRNQLYMWPKLVRDVWRFRPPLGAALRTAFMAFSVPAVIVNGRVVASRRLPDREQLLQEVERLSRPGASARHPLDWTAQEVPHR